MKAAKILFTSLVMGFLLFQGSAKASGNDLLRECGEFEKYTNGVQEPDLFLLGSCLGMVEGVRTTMYFLDSNDVVCFPEGGITNGQAASIVLAFLRDNPAHLHLNKVVLTMFAFRNAYACSE